MKKLGFSDKEISVYLALLKIGSASYTALAQTTGIKRPSLYPIVQALQDRGIVRYLADDKKMAPLPPDQLFQLLQDTTLQLHSIIPQLKDLHKPNPITSHLMFYRGAENIRQAYLEEEKQMPPVNERTIRVISDGKTWDSFWQQHDRDFTEKYLANAKAHSFKWKVLATHDDSHAYSQEVTQKYNVTFKQINDAYKSEFDMEVRPTQVIIANLATDKPYAIKIVSDEIAHALANFFDFAWQTS